ncbi:MAG: T9SS type A sorting domain-containing protein [Ignavibacteria bacterium]|nr:T9SS type A sorting domain-containing protein [Ignavibacteria bacterium]
MKKFYKIILIELIFLLITGNIIYAQGNTYYSKGSLPPNLTDSWVSDTISNTGYPPNFTSGDIFVIRWPHTMTTNGIWSISGRGSKLQIADGGILESQHQITLSNETTFRINNGGKYIHNYSVETLSGLPPPSVFNGIESFAQYSTVEINNWDWSNGNKIADFPVVNVWGNLIMRWNPTTAGTDWNLKSRLTVIGGNFTFDVSGSTTNFISLAVGGTPLTLTINGNLNIYNGKLQFASNPQSSTPGYTLYLWGNYNQTGGIFDHIQSNQPLAFIFRGNANTTFTHSGGDLLNDYINWVIYSYAVYKLNNNLPVASNRSLVINNYGTLDCALNLVTGAGAFTINEDATLKTAHSNGVDGSITTGSKTFIDNSSYIFYGNSDQNTGISIPSSVREFTIDKNNSSGVSISKDVNVQFKLWMTSGKIRTGAYTLKLGFNNTFPGILEYTSGKIIGKFARYFVNQTSVFKLFPMGTETYYRQVEIAYTVAPTWGGILTVEHKDVNPSHTNQTLYIEDEGGYKIDRYSQKGYWIVTPDEDLFGGTYSINLRMEGIVGADNPPQLRVLKRRNFFSDWVLEGIHEDGEGQPEYPTVKRTGLDRYSEFAIGGNSEDNNPLEGSLPVKLASFNFAVSNRDVRLNWVTEMEENNSGFEVQKTEYRSQESEVWNKVGFVKGSGNKNSATSYSFEDKGLNTGKYKYRLKQIDYNGNFEYFELAGVVEVGVPAKFDLNQNYPNPFNPVTKIDFALPQSGLVSLKVYDVLGKEVSTILNEFKDAGYYTVSFDAAGLSSGVYFYRLNVNGFSSVKRLVVMK